VCVAVAILFPGWLLFNRILQPTLFAVVMNDANRLASLATVLLAAGIFALHRYRVVRPSTILTLGMALEFVGAFAISMIETTVPLKADQPVLGVSTLAPWIVIFALLVHDRPLWTLLSATAAAATWPVAHAINAVTFHHPPAPASLLSVWSIFNVCMVALTYLVSRQIYATTRAADTTLDLGSYRLVAKIGEGGVGEVWKASHRLLARPAAIKLIRQQQLSGREADLAERRFRREADATASLQSPHTVYLYDFGISNDGRFYYAMELLDGLSLQALVATFGPLPSERVVHIMRQICRSLDEAHRCGMVHRDLKPSNVMLCKVATSHDFVKVLDFGLAKFVDNPELSRLTMAGTATGTPGYVAPEVALGESSIDARADIYALGCVAYFLLTGTLVFDDPNPMKMVLQHVKEAPMPPSARTDQPIPDSLERLVMQCLAKAPGDRPATAAVLGAMLATCEVEPWTDADTEAWWNEHLPADSPLRPFARSIAPALRS
jgi:serine/threonine-protein kinase